MSLAELLRAVAAKRVAGSVELPISGLRHDSREVVAGDLFFAMPGAKTDGNRHARQAFENGAVAVVSELEPPPPPAVMKGTWIQVPDIAEAMAGISDLFYGHPSGAMTMVGVTGTNGKTTTTYLLESIVKEAGGRPAVAGTIENRLNGERLEKSINTTPISLTLTKLLARFRDGGATHGLLEVSSHALALKRVESVDFDAGIFLNLTRDHLDFHKTVDAYFDAKARLFDLLARADNKKSPRVAALNFDDPRAHLLVKHAVDCEVVRFGLTDAATDLKATIRKSDLNGTEFGVTFRGKAYDARVRLPGRHNVENAMAAAAAMLGLNVAPENVFNGIAALRAVPGRLESISEGQDFHVFVDYAHTDSALESILALLRSLPHRRIITVIGCGGDRDKTKRGPMGLAACRGGDLAIFTSDNPRSEDPAAILNDIESGVSAAQLQNYKMITDRGEAIAAAIAAARSNDVVLIAGKGHEDYQILHDRTIAFDDREAARAALRTLK
ncbi:MAG: UDP-N-acetylmuramoyl-L-alanyl-D-glutamate--2,6-diaminopimelate ligase [Elusimicrobiota bacterium]|nr:UDP-N-acetylmuramoyl-L-alanyl-D-glutamate--2,6-diaminopimelate ligase [Elusimicrobiota bacterium]